MTDLLEHAVERIRSLSPERQNEFARVILRLADDDEAVYLISPEEDASLAKSLAQADRGEFATDDHVRAIWAKHGL